MSQERLTIVGARGTEGQAKGWFVSDGGDPRGDENTDIQLWDNGDDTAVDPHTWWWYSCNFPNSGRGSIIANMDAANNPPLKDKYFYFDGSRTGESILAELGLKTANAGGL